VKKKRIAFLESRLQEFCDEIKNFKIDKNVTNKMKELDINTVFKSSTYITGDSSKNKAIEIKDKFNMFNIPSDNMNESSNILFHQYDDRSTTGLQNNLPKQDDKNVNIGLYLVVESDT
jgi:hypothetical protein